jgi:hypothetical protein
MLAVSAVLPDIVPDHPPVILIHGSANSAAVWTFWQQELAVQGWPSYAIWVYTAQHSRAAEDTQL